MVGSPPYLEHASWACVECRESASPCLYCLYVVVGCQLTQFDLVVGAPDAGRWPSLAKHLEAVRSRPSFQADLEACGKMRKRMLPEKVDLS